MDLNEVNLIGRATADAELKQTPQGQYVTTFSIATGEKFTKEDGTKVETVEFSNIVVWGKLAEIAGKYVTKGKRLYLKGKLKTRNWDDKDSGKKMYRTEIVGKDLILLDGGNKENWIQSDEDFKNDVKKSTRKVPEDEISVEDIPF